MLQRSRSVESQELPAGTLTVGKSKTAFFASNTLRYLKYLAQNINAQEFSLDVIQSKFYADAAQVARHRRYTEPVSRLPRRVLPAMIA
jgi:hypothetical protein